MTKALHVRSEPQEATEDLVGVAGIKGSEGVERKAFPNGGSMRRTSLPQAKTCLDADRRLGTN